MNNTLSTSRCRATTLRHLLVILLLSVLPLAARAQDIAVKTNLLYWATTTPNVGLEVALGPKTTAQVFYGLNPWQQSGGNTSSLRHWLV